ncbi:DUF302 domain-containing protein [Tunturiibacter gelidoferens]|uniref:Uncharacterized protein (DUF302 family) n=1 Tax=Tunturiibacter gelidiferens TaxID=3069689 RepID=A0ACC5P1N9_9BACT|nr:DUF302 domain-containing protein [Edaphobacter lichenicola]MBB5340747.1 uncharacterized protein (DUF302 family) [Edaphobacter lichenicola]
MTDQQTREGIKICTSRYSVDETVSRLEALLKEKGVKRFAVVDHSGEAAAAGLEMSPTKLLIFGSPKAGTPVMLAAPSAALDLPLKILVAEGADGKVLLSWNDPAWLEQRHGFPPELTANLAAAGMFATKAAQ